MKDIYLDNAATTRPHPKVVAKVMEMLTEKYGNPSSTHRMGDEAKGEVEAARQIVADALGAEKEEIYFTSGGTEANNLAIIGGARGNHQVGNHLVTSAAEHGAVTKPIRSLKREGWTVNYIGAAGGRLDLAALEEVIGETTVLVSIMMVNNETGCVFPIREVKNIIAKKGSPALLHCDAVQAFGKVPFRVTDCGADLVSVSAHKIHGVKGSGALYVRKGVTLSPLFFGGGQEKGLRSGTESSPLISAFGEAVKWTFDDLAGRMGKMAKLRDYCMERVGAEIPGVVMNSSRTGAPHIVNFSLPGLKSQVAVDYLSQRGVFVSGGAACKSNYSRGPSVLESLGLERGAAERALRISFSPDNGMDEVDRLVDCLKACGRELT